MAEADLAPQPGLISEVQQKYGIGPNYARAYLAFWSQGHGRAYANLQEILASPMPEPMWFEYALLTNRRGQNMYSLIAPRIPRGARRYLDVGCGFGGFLVVFAEHGLEVRGIEIDQQRIDLGRANCLDYGVGDCILHASVLSDDLVSRLGRFDVITCVDVIEHVLDVPKALGHMIALLNPGGILVLEIPNKDSLYFVARDGHFSLFGITLLGRPNAVDYHRAFFAFDYDVGDYHELATYMALLGEMGCVPQILVSSLPGPRRLRAVVRLALGALAAYVHFAFARIGRVPFHVYRNIHSGFIRYMARFMLASASLLSPSRNITAYKERYLIDFWTVGATKLSGNVDDHERSL